MDVQQTVPPYNLILHARILVNPVFQLLHVEIQEERVTNNAMMEILWMEMDVHLRVHYKFVEMEW